MLFIQRVFIVSILGLVFLTDNAFSQGGDVAERFSAFDPNSKVRVNHEPLSDYLAQTVFPVGRSHRILGEEKVETYRGSRIKTAKPLEPSRYEGGRLFIHAFTEDHDAFFKVYQEGLERLSERRSLSEFNKDQQLAYWLNLYNVIVINKIVEEYPIRRLKSLRSTKRRKKSFWDEKVTTVEGVPLSLKNIETILFNNFESPLVAFGLWQGSIGGPRLNNLAFTGSNVWNLLEENAVEFVNSNRGLRPPAGSRMSVSKFYEWVKPAFGTRDSDVLGFIKRYADSNFVPGIGSVSSLNYNLYNWVVADVMGGTLHQGTKTQMGGILNGRTRNVASAPDPHNRANTIGSSNGGVTGGNSNLFRLYKWVDTFEKTPLVGLPDSFLALLEGVLKNNRLPIPIITSTECAPGEDCSIEEVGDQ